ncbi:type I polyketide synthase [Nocardia speluncae]|uniref:Type I polyketide synthase n=1 Tax=Nocardia speluncae TaxID=419477 RepID=A0A846XC05_9NOCA|nr:type I polyketide synthase [Nocardia speluncae]NKY33861.1 type I polyketide synthase [Nocardia speluncae]
MNPDVDARTCDQFDGGSDAVALIDGQRQWTYADLESAVTAMAYRIQSADRGGNRVAVAVPRSAAGVVAMLAVWRSGRTYVALDPLQPAQRNVDALKLVGATLVVVPDESTHSFAPTVTVLPVRFDSTERPDRPEQVPAPRDPLSLAPEIAYIVFTSGSTGLPKGVQMPSAAISGLIRWHLANDNRPGRRTALFAAVGFDVAIQEILATFAEGGTLVVVDDATRRDPVALAQALRREAVQRVFLPTAALQLVAEEWITGGAPECLETVICAGEQLQLSAAVRELFRLLPQARLQNHYGPAETHVVMACELDPDPDQWPELAPLGQCLPHVATAVHFVDQDAEVGELEIIGVRVAAGYLGAGPEDAARFGTTADGSASYRTGDLVRKQGNSLVFVGRVDRQVKVNGYRVEPGATETALLRHADVTGCAVEPRGSGFEMTLMAYITVRPNTAVASRPHSVLSEYLKPRLPIYQIPTHWEVVDALPLTVNGKIDRAGLPLAAGVGVRTGLDPDRRSSRKIGTTSAVIDAYTQALGRSDFNHDGNFFDLGGTSLLAARVRRSLVRSLHRSIPITMIYDNPSALSLAAALSGGEKGKGAPRDRGVTQTDPTNTQGRGDETPIAIIGMACRFPEASSLDEFWENLVTGRDCVRREYAPDGSLLRAGGMVEHLEHFDTNLFPISAREAALLDPQHRMFLETCWTALESAGLPPGQLTDKVGLYGGVGPSTYLINNVLPAALHCDDRTFLDSSSDLQMLLATDKDYLTSRVAYLLDLRGPVFSVQAACATGLVAVHLAVQALRSGECEVALAGAANAAVPQMGRYRDEAGMVLAPDGRTRSYDQAAEGTVFSSGAGVVVLKPLAEAEAAGDPIVAVLGGSAVGNDGANKVAMAAPSTRGQAAVIRAALESAGLSRDELDYVEGHGTATPVGDPIEVQALNSVLAPGPEGAVWLGSVKSQIGHTGTASGMAALIKTVLCIQHRTMTATAHFQSPNRDAPFADGPLQVVTDNRTWPSRGAGIPRRAGVSAFGLGGVNAHLVVNEYLRTTDDSPQFETSHRRAVELIPVSAASEAACVATLATLGTVTDVPAEHVAHTLATGRAQLRWRVSAVVPRHTVGEALRSLSDQVTAGTRRAVSADPDGKLVMMFTGHHPSGLDLRELNWPVVRSVVEAADPVMTDVVGVSASDVLFGGQAHHDPLIVGQAAQFVLQVALAEQWRDWGVVPDVVIGHSLGEFAAAFTAGVFTLETGIRLVAARGQLLHDLPPDGAMAVIGAAPDAIHAAAGDAVDIAAINGPENVVVSGPGPSIDALCECFSTSGHRVKPLMFGRAGHSRAIETSLPAFHVALAAERLTPPKVGFISNLTGQLVGAEVASPEYWIQQLRGTVQFGAGLAEAASIGTASWLEVGPAPVLAGIAAHSLGEDAVIAPSMRVGQSPEVTMLTALGTLWERGVDVAWEAVTDPAAIRISLPGVSFDRRRHWIDPPQQAQLNPIMPPVSEARWVPDPRPSVPLLRGHWLILGATEATGRSLADALHAAGHLCTFPSDWPTLSDTDIRSTRARLDNYISTAAVPLSGLVCLDALGLPELPERDLASTINSIGSRTLAILQQLCGNVTPPLRTLLVTRGLVDAEPGSGLAQACIAGLARSATREYPDLTCARFDLPAESTDELDATAIVAAMARFDEADTAYRDGQLLVRRVVDAEFTSGNVDRAPVDEKSGNPLRSLDPDGCYLVTGGTGGLGVLTAAVLLEKGAALVVLCSRTTPTPSDWQTVCSEIQRNTGTADVLSKVAFEAADVSNRKVVEDLVQKWDQPSRPLRGVVHGAAELADATLHNQDARSFARAINAKALGAWHLHEELRTRPGIHLFTCYTSATGFLGNPGQANYAAACSFVDALMDARARVGLPGQSIAWGPWASVGHLQGDTAMLESLHRAGMGVMRRESGVQAITELIGERIGAVAVLVNNWTRWREGANIGELAALVDASPVPDAVLESTVSSATASHERSVDTTAVTHNQSQELAELLATGNRHNAHAKLTAAVVDAAATILGTRPDPDSDLSEVGLDSLSAVQLRNAITRLVGEQLPVAACLELRTCSRLAGAALDRITDVPQATVKVNS